VPCHEPHGGETAPWVPCQNLGACDGPLPDVTGTPGGGYAGQASGACAGSIKEEFELLGVPFEHHGARKVRFEAYSLTNDDMAAPVFAADGTAVSAPYTV
jgi:hypothetical protein